MIPRSISSDSKFGRIIFIDRSNDLTVFDVVEKRVIFKKNVGSQAPLKQYKILDTAFDERLGRYYILNEGWVLEIWDTLDLSGRATPITRIRLFAE